MVLALLHDVQASGLLPCQRNGHCQHTQAPVDGLRSWTVKSLELTEGSVLTQVGTGLGNFRAYIDAADMGVGVGVVQFLLGCLVTNSRATATLQEGECAKGTEGQEVCI